MLRAVNCILLILILLLSALFGFIALLIVATEQPESLLDKLYAGTQHARNDTVYRLLASKKLPVTSKVIINTFTKLVTVTESSLHATSNESTISATTVALQSTLSSKKPDPTNSTVRRLVLVPARLKLGNTAKVMSIGLQSKETFYAAKVSGEVEFFNRSTLVSVKNQHLGVPIHRLAFLSDNRLVVTETQTRTLHLFDSSFKVVAQLKLAYQALDLQVFDDMIYILSRLDGTIFVYDSDLSQKFKITWEKQNSCNFIWPARDCIYVSCDSAIFKLSPDGTVVQNATIPGALYALAVYVPPAGDEVWTAQRGREEIHVYDQNLKFQYKMIANSTRNAIWSAIGTDEGQVFALDYVSNVINFFVI